VFRVTDRPEIHSNGFCIYFDVKSDALGYILPHWISNTDETETAVNVDMSETKIVNTSISDDTTVPDWMTKIVLPLKDEMREHRQSLSLAARFRDIHPSLLLFLHRLRSITIINKVEDYHMDMRRKDIGDVTEISHSAGLDRWLVVRKSLDASKISAQAKSGIEVESTEIALAFTLPQRDQSNPLSHTPQKQQVFAFLPVRSYGFRFIVQGDFDVPSSREDVDRDSLWNQWLRSEIHHAFVDALDIFKVCLY